MIGVSLPYKWLNLEENCPDIDRDTTLDELFSLGVDSIELRTVLKDSRCEDVLEIAEILWARGFKITVHSRMYSAESAVNDVFAPLKLLLDNLRQKELVIVLHGIVADNVAILTELSDYAIINGYPVKIALENNRLMPDESEGDSAAYVLDVVKQVNRDNVGVCFDMGHYAYYVKKNNKEAEGFLPSEEFIRRTIHTHIHALKGLKTHYPLGDYELALGEILPAIEYNYFGVYNLELDFPRLSGEVDPRSALISSVKHLAAALPPCARLYRRIRREYDTSFNNALGIYNKDTSGTVMSLANCTFYLFNTSGYRWAMDAAFRYVNYLADTPSRAAELLRDVKLMVVTHGHVDHFEEPTVRALLHNDMLWVIPDFLLAEAKEWGIPDEKIIIARENQPICIERLTILPFKGRHFRPTNGQGVDEYGYYITTDSGLTMAFPADVRDYRLEGLTHMPPADVCFAHVFLGDSNAYADDYTERVEEFARFMLHFSDKRIILAHLYESGRRDIDTWRRDHAELIANALKAIKPDIITDIPDWGDRLVLN